MLDDDFVTTLRNPQTVDPWRFGIVAIEQRPEPADHDAGIAVDRRIEIGAASQRLGCDRIGLGGTATAAQAMLDWAAREYPALRPASVSGNYCSDKKVSAVNGILGRGRSVIAEILLPAAVCRDALKTTAAAVVFVRYAVESVCQVSPR